MSEEKKPIIEYSHSGGFAGTRSSLSIYADGTLETKGSWRPAVEKIEESQLMAILGMFIEKGFANLDGYYDAPHVCDGYQDMVTLRTEEAEKTVRVDMMARPPQEFLEIQSTLDLLVEKMVPHQFN